jgi:hypothetical protein
MLTNESDQEDHVKQAVSFGYLFACCLCKAYRKPWAPFRRVELRAEVALLGERPWFRAFDCFPYNGESELLLIRLRTLSAYVTAFILAFSNTSNSGRENRTLTFAPYESEIIVFQNQLRVHLTDVTQFGSRPWDREHGLRDYLLVCVRLEQPGAEDSLLQSDLDEIP